MSDEQELQDSLKPESKESAPEMVPKSDVDKLYARMKQAEEKEKESREELAVLKQNPASATPKDWEREIELTRLMAKGYSDEEAQFVIGSGGLNNPFVKAGIEALRDKAKVEQAQPSASRVTAPAEESKIESWNKLSNSDRKKVWDDALSKAASRRSGQPI